MKLSRIIRPHSKKCFMKGKENPWSGLIKGDGYFGNHAGNGAAKSGRHHYWYIISCNDPSCNAEKIVHSSVLANA